MAPVMKKDATALNLIGLDDLVESPAPLQLRIGRPRYSRWERFAKRAIDVLGALTVLTLGAPLLAVIAIAVKLSSRGPVFFRQVRLGRDGKPFHFYKFRSMHHKNDDTVHRRFAANFINGGEVDEEGEEQVFKMVRDPRVTPIGQFLRRSSLDELPQFWNVLRGEMSLVGPRPPIAYELEHYQEWHKDRLKVTPGLTGLWQVSGRSTVGFDEMVMLDLHYISRWSLKLDLKIIARTLPVMIKGEGAY
jgi:exopolysaccharide biosynthesis polyprenyl glycosylphosphotransferase